LKEMKYKKNILGFLLFFWGSLVFAQMEFPLPQDTREKWVVGFCALKGKNLSPQNTYLTQSIPLLLKENLQSIALHSFNEQEMLEYKKAVLMHELRAKLKTLIEKQKEKDELIFSQEREFEKQKKIQNLEKEIEDIRAHVSFLKDLDPALIEYKNQKPVQFSGGTAEGLYDPPLSILKYTVQEDVDLLISGKIEEIHDYIYIELNAFERTREKKVYTYTDAGTREELYDYFGEAIGGLATIILGREWSSLTLIPQPEDASIIINGQYFGSGKIYLPFNKPGQVEILVRYPGYKEHSKKVVLIPSEYHEYTISLQREVYFEIAISTTPPDADVYINSRWQGKTPLLLARPVVLQRLLIIKEDYLDYYMTIGPDSEQKIDIYLKKGYPDRAEIQEMKRDNFYASFGTFLCTLPIPIFLYGSAVDSTNYSRPDIENRVYGIFYYFSYFASVALLANTLFCLADYIQAGDNP
jgi:hypothetical protein